MSLNEGRAASIVTRPRVTSGPGALPRAMTAGRGFVLGRDKLGDKPLTGPGPFVLGRSRLDAGFFLAERANADCHDEPQTFRLGQSFLGRGDVLG